MILVSELIICSIILMCELYSFFDTGELDSAEYGPVINPGLGEPYGMAGFCFHLKTVTSTDPRYPLR